MKGILFGVAFFIALGIVGNDDFEQAQSAHKTLCERAPQPEFCRGEIK